MCVWALIKCSVAFTIAWTGVEPVVDIEGAGFACDGCGHGLVRVVLILRQENI